MTSQRPMHRPSRLAGLLTLTLTLAAAASAADERVLASMSSLEQAADSLEGDSLSTKGSVSLSSASFETAVGWDPQTAVLSTPAVSPAAASADASLGADLSQPGVLPALSPIEEVDDPGAYPARVNVSMAATFALDSGSCSGTLVDSRHVLTAAHCIHNEAAGGWPTSAIVSPGDGSYGHAEAEHYWTFEGWTDHRDWQYDLALVRLDRPVGALTGWHALGTMPCWLSTSGWFHTYSFPALGPYAGEMVYMEGRFEACYGSHQVHAWDQAYEGMSGGGFYELDGGIRVARAVWSRHHPTMYGSLATRVWNGAFDSFVDKIHDARGNDPDLIPIGTESDTEEIWPQLDPDFEVEFYVHNYSDADWQGWMDANVVLSTNLNISNSDPVVGSVHQWVEIPAMGSLKFEADASVPLWMLPAFTSVPATRYVGVVVQTPNSDPQNDDTKWVLTTPRLSIHLATAELEIELDAQDGSYLSTDRLPLDLAVENTGLLASGELDVDVYLSPSASFDFAGKVHIASGELASIGAGHDRAVSDSAFIPQDTHGTFYVHVALTDAEGEVALAHDPDPVFVFGVADGLQGPPPNLRVDYVGFAPGDYEPGDLLPVAFSVTNAGTQSSGVWSATFYATKLPDMSRETVVVATGQGPSLSGGESYGGLVDIPLDGLGGGAWHIALEVDVAGDAAPDDNLLVSAASFELPYGIVSSPEPVGAEPIAPDLSFGQ